MIFRTTGGLDGVTGRVVGTTTATRFTTALCPQPLMMASPASAEQVAK
jgi:hypothetical protein